LPRQLTATFNLLKTSIICSPSKNYPKLDGANKSPLNKTKLSLDPLDSIAVTNLAAPGSKAGVSP